MYLKFLVYRVEYDTVHNGLHGTTATEEADGAEFKELIGSLFVRLLARTERAVARKAAEEKIAAEACRWGAGCRREAASRERWHTKRLYTRAAAERAAAEQAAAV